MTHALGVLQIQRLEEYTIKTVGIPSVVLMDRAGEAVARSLLRFLVRKNGPKVTIVCGTGNNGGDGFVAARYLWAAGVKAKVLVAGPLKDLKDDPKIFYKVLNALHVPVMFLKDLNPAALKILMGSDVIIDALFGIGLNRPLNGVHEKFVTAMNRSRAQIWSVDIPSGLDGTTGKILGTCVKSSTTVSFTCLKKGFLVNDGPEVAGCMEVVDIGIPQSILRKFGG